MFDDLLTVFQVLFIIPIYCIVKERTGSRINVLIMRIVSYHRDVKGYANYYLILSWSRGNVFCACIYASYFFKVQFLYKNRFCWSSLGLANTSGHRSMFKPVLAENQNLQQQLSGIQFEGVILNW